MPVIDIIHIVIVHDDSGAVLVDLRLKFHFSCNRRVHACQLSCQNTHFIQGGAGFLAADPDISGPRLHICEPAGHNPGGIILGTYSLCRLRHT